MTDVTQMIVPSRQADFVELARSQKGRLFRKHILTKGELLHPKTGSKIQIDDDFVQKLTQNFQAKVCDIVQVPKAGPNNEHTEDPDRNIGEVVGIEEKDGKIYAVIDARADADKLGKTLLGASAMMHMDYTDTRTGQKVGPTLLHVAVTNRPYVVDLEDYEELVAASSEGSGDTVLLTPEEEAPASTPDEAPNAEPTEEPIATPVDDEPPVISQPEVTEAPVENDPAPEGEAAPAEPEAAGPSTTSEHDTHPDHSAATEEIDHMDLDALLATLKSEHNIDVPALMASAQAAEGATNLTNTLTEALAASGVVKLSNGEEISPDDIVGAVAELATTNVALSNRLGILEKDRAAAQVDALIAEGRVLPAQRDTYIELRLSQEALFDKLVPAEPIVRLSNEEGVTPEPKAQEAQEEDIDAEILRYSQQAASQGYVRS